MEEKDTLHFSNYCVAFIDLLGQQDALKGQTVLPIIDTEEDYLKFVSEVKGSIGSISALQKMATEFVKASGVNPQWPDMTKQQKEDAEEIKKAIPKEQRWSDGLVYFLSIGEHVSKSSVTGIIQMMYLTGALCFLGLAAKKPLRGALEIGWGVELNNGEINGAALANSYQLESQVAGYPRIVIGENLYLYLASLRETKEIKPIQQYNKHLASRCLDMISVDIDGHYILDYLSPAFTDSVTKKIIGDLFSEAYENICSDYEKFRNSKDTKLATRYFLLKSYFEASEHFQPDLEG